MEILTLLEYKTAIQSTSPTDDDKLNFIIDFVNKFIPRYCNTSFKPVTVIDELCTRFGDAILLDNAPAISVESVSARAVDGTLTTISPSSYRLNKAGGYINIILSEPLLSDREFGVSVDYTYGFSTPPEDITMAAIELVNTYKSKNFYSSKSSGSGDTLTMMKQTIIPMHIKSILDFYRVI